ncbi:MAG: 3',5'-cyclic-nucleotide phosphodiesterase [Candidatus Muproteobacteria bacterium RIFCSPHIGHO2_01_FULL_65_16]|uniref:3',5'-cyclic-nucleotide phosphodiesterase n=1 Tax=Candidatus Muproteobacteria bacterium RIFCSPHIGHO2_01_FULL_65_16 TaxID=1817764 RepID=A0A1F6TF83_9PROT|nr:MAG: 3',5'-cyclic-nucleotide phosphodiesterase [Candidatus Muproteobacteria bacterium RIFCSPHIGHO2_01_FULL_65_16]
MQIRVLGCSGGIGAGRSTTSFLLDRDVLIDAGTGVGALDTSALLVLDHVFLTHSHLDHVAALPFLLDTFGAGRRAPLQVHAQEATVAALKAHVFNDKIWPDFTRIPSPETPLLALRTLNPGEEVTLAGRSIRAIPVNHAVPAVGYLIRGPGGSLAFSGDTTVTDEFWRVLNDCADLKHLIVETSYTDAEAELARIARHMCPRMLVGELQKLRRRAQIHITHLMPGREDTIMREIAGHIPHDTPRRLMPGEIFEL